jgi:hypothetical protein
MKTSSEAGRTHFFIDGWDAGGRDRDQPALAPALAQTALAPTQTEILDILSKERMLRMYAAGRKELRKSQVSAPSIRRRRTTILS